MKFSMSPQKTAKIRLIDWHTDRDDVIRVQSEGDPLEILWGEEEFRTCTAFDREDYIAIGVEMSEHIVSYSVMNLNHHENHAVWLQLMASKRVTRSLRTKLAERTMVAVKKCGISRIYYPVRSQNKEKQHFLKRLGFGYCDTSHDFYSEPADDMSLYGVAIAFPGNIHFDHTLPCPLYFPAWDEWAQNWTNPLQPNPRSRFSFLNASTGRSASLF